MKESAAGINNDASHAMQCAGLPAQGHQQEGRHALIENVRLQQYYVYEWQRATLERIPTMNCRRDSRICFRLEKDSLPDSLGHLHSVTCSMTWM
jgi:hypothetical protein